MPPESDESDAGSRSSCDDRTRALDDRSLTLEVIKGPKGPEPALVSLISLTMVDVVVTAAAVGSSEALRGHLDSRRGVPLSGLFEGDATRT